MAPEEFRIGGERPVRRLGFGAMRLPAAPGPARQEAIAVARRAVELGVTLIDTAYLYGWGANEELLAEALHPYPDDLLITTKVGVVPPEGSRDARIDGRPEVLRAQVEQGLRRLRAAVAAMGTTLHEPFLQMAFLALPVIPHLKITDKGLVDVDRFELVS